MELEERIFTLGGKSNPKVEECRDLIQFISRYFSLILIKHGFDKRQVLRLTTKFRDAGRRSPPWKPASSKVPGRPQDGSDGNRISRWLLEIGHKFHATEIDATLVEVKYYLQALSMTGAPTIPEKLQTRFSWLIEHDVAPGNYLDPIQLLPISLKACVDDARTIQSGHLVPLDRGGRHVPQNAFLMLARSNQLQGNLTVEELLTLMESILQRHQSKRS